MQKVILCSGLVWKFGDMTAVILMVLRISQVQWATWIFSLIFTTIKGLIHSNEDPQLP